MTFYLLPLFGMALLVASVIVFFFLLLKKRDLKNDLHTAELNVAEADALIAKLRAELEANKVANKAPHPTTDARQLLHDLTQGGALVRVIPIDPNDVFLRSQR